MMGIILLFTIGWLIIGAMAFAGGVLWISADRGQWRRKAEKATAMAEWLADMARDGIFCPASMEPDCNYDEKVSSNCIQCWLNAADTATKEAADDR